MFSFGKSWLVMATGGGKHEVDAERFMRIDSRGCTLFVGFLWGGVQGEGITGEPQGFLGKIGEP